MSQKLKLNWYLLLLSGCLIVSGCDSASNSSGTSESEGPELISSGQEQDQTSPEAGTNPESADSDPNNGDSSGEDSDEPQAYKPPFPDRVDLFLPPKRGAKSIAQGRKEGESAVQLLGFSNVNEALVVLSIDGYVYPVAEGERKSGIEVVSIKPPAVVLQRGRQVWQASLEN